MSTDPIQTLLVAANYYDAMSEVGGARDALARMEQLRDAAADLDSQAAGRYWEVVSAEALERVRAALAGCATTQENTE